jgi:hypothetical protein
MAGQGKISLPQTRVIWCRFYEYFPTLPAVRYRAYYVFGRCRVRWALGPARRGRIPSRRHIMNSKIIIAALLVLTLSACGNRPGERALSGAGIGAGVGLVGGALVGAPLQGAAIGGAVGAGTGALTSPSQINLNR